MKNDPTERALGEIRALRDAPEGRNVARELASFLSSRSNQVIKSAARLAGNLDLQALAPELAAAFARLMKDPAKLDRGCEALLAIATTLVGWGYEDAKQEYLAGVHHVQMEASFGPPVDAAAPLRGVCARGLVRARHPEALHAAVDLLTDGWPPARAGAAQALWDAGGREAILALRLKAVQGDHEDVLSECFRALLALDPGASVNFVARFLGREENTCAAAALALGESRLAEAFPPLRDAYGRAADRASISLAIAMLRCEDGIEFLLRCCGEDEMASAGQALRALALYRTDKAIRARAATCLEVRDSPALRKIWNDEWD